MKLGCTYICVSDIDKSLPFYKTVLNMEPVFQNENRWIEFDCGNTLCLYNDKFDENLLNKKQGDKHFNQEYIQKFNKEETNKVNTMVVFNFVVEDIDYEYQRIKDLGIKVSELMYVNIFKAYWYFTIYDPDGNELEITGERKK